MAKWGEINCPRCAELEAKLAKAVEAMQFWSEAVEPDVDKAITLMASTLAELKGQGDACVSCGAPTPNDFCGFCLEEE